MAIECRDAPAEHVEVGLPVLDFREVLGFGDRLKRHINPDLWRAWRPPPERSFRRCCSDHWGSQGGRKTRHHSQLPASSLAPFSRSKPIGASCSGVLPKTPGEVIMPAGKDRPSITTRWIAASSMARSMAWRTRTSANGLAPLMLGGPKLRDRLIHAEENGPDLRGLLHLQAIGALNAGEILQRRVENEINLARQKRCHAGGCVLDGPVFDALHVARGIRNCPTS